MILFGTDSVERLAVFRKGQVGSFDFPEYARGLAVRGDEIPTGIVV